MEGAVKREIKEIETLMLEDKSLAYASLLVLQRTSAENAASMETLSLRSPLFFPALLADIYHQEEEIAAQALKCLGFMLYHQSLISSISEGGARSALDSLSGLIVMTKMKAICNLGIWCISVQQLDAITVECCFDKVLGAVVYAIDNPFGSLSTTFEAIQAVMKIATQLAKKMREAASIWLPPIYRRLISYDKKERDIAERCLVKTKSIICPAPSTLSNALAQDLKNTLLARIMNMQPNILTKACIIQAWGWYVCLLGSYVLNDRCLVNQMLKLPEQTFTDAEPQVQIASLVAWEHLINAFLLSNQEKIPACRSFPESVNNELSKDLLRRIKVLMVPLQGIISAKCDISVHMACLSTWHCLLHNLDLLVNHPSVLQIAFKPFIEMVFSKKTDNRHILLWKPCLNLFDQYVSGSFKSDEIDLIPTACECDVTNLDSPLHPTHKIPQMHHSINWLPWKVGDLGIPLSVIKAVLSHGQMTPVDPEIRTFALSSALRFFKTVVLAVRAEIERPGASIDMIQLYLTAILTFMKEFCEEVSSRKDRKYSHDLLWIAFQSLDVVREELGFWLMTSHLYQVPSDLMHIKLNIHAIVKGSVGSLDIFSPMVYTSFLLLDALAQCILHLSEMEGVAVAIQHVKSLLFSLNPSVNLKAAVCFLYGHLSRPLDAKMNSLMLWSVITKSLNEKIDAVIDTTHIAHHYLFCYPFSLLYDTSMDGDCSALCLISSQRDRLLKDLIQVWNTYFANASFPSAQNNFLNCMCEVLIKVVDEDNTFIRASEKSLNMEAFAFFSEMLICIFVRAVMNIERLRVSLGGRDGHFSPIRNVLFLFERFLGMLLMVSKMDWHSELVIIDRVFDAMTRLVGNLFLKQDVLKLLEVISSPLIQIFLVDPFSDEAWRGVNHQLYCLWTNILSSLRRTHSPINFDSNHLRSHAPLLRAALDHPYPPISNATVKFWKATYGKNKLVHFPDCLLPVVHKLSRGKGRSLQRKGVLFSSQGLCRQSSR